MNKEYQSSNSIYREEFRDDPALIEAQADIVEAIMQLSKNPENIAELNKIAHAMIWLGDGSRFSYVDLFEALEYVNATPQDPAEKQDDYVESAFNDLEEQIEAARTRSDSKKG